ncbi:MAG: PAS domain S-box protein [Kiritimatiellia bacterium]
MSRMRIDQTEIRDADIFEILLDSFPDMIHSIDHDGNIIYTNRTAETLLGYTRQELLGMNIREIYADEVLEAVEKGFSDLKERGDKRIPESLLKTKDGTRIPVEIRSFSIYDDEGSFLRTFSILRDIREIKQLQQTLVHASRLAAIGELASGVAHDINNPVTVILLSNEMMQRELQRADPASPAGMERLKALADDTQKASKSIQKLADHLRNFSRGMAERYETVDLYDSISDALFMTQNKIKTSNVEVDNSVTKGRYYVNGLPNHMEQVFVNIISNACDAMSEGEESRLAISIEPCRREEADFWLCSVSDTGKGIPGEIISDIFQSFFTTKEKGDGTGLGLSISRGIIRDHKGDIEAESEPGKGTTFRIFLPQASLD